MSGRIGSASGLGFLVDGWGVGWRRFCALGAPCMIDSLGSGLDGGMDGAWLGVALHAIAVLYTEIYLCCLGFPRAITNARRSTTERPYIAPSSFSFAIMSFTSPTLSPPFLGGGSSTLTVSSLRRTSTPISSSVFLTMGFFLAFMILGKLA